MFEAEINKLKEKKSNTVLTFKESYDKASHNKSQN